MKALAIAVMGLSMAATMQVTAQQTDTGERDDREQPRAKQERRETVALTAVTEGQSNPRRL